MADKTQEEGIATDDATTKANEWNDKVNAFVGEYGALVKKHQIDFATFPQFIPDGQGGFKVVVQNTPVDISNQPVRSPLDGFIAK